MAVNLSPVLGVAGQFFDNNGNPLAGGKIFTYAAGTTTNQATYTSATGLIAHSNPIILDAAGRVPSGEIWLTDGLSYKFVIKTSLDTLIGSFDNLVGINSNFINFLTETEIQTATAGQTVFTLTTMQYQPNTNSLSVFVDGVNQYDGSSYAYVETSSTVITFTTGLHVGALVKFTTAQTLSSGVTDASLVTYDPPFAGSVPTNVEVKLSETVSVKDFGAVGDGVTDDAAAFQKAVDAVSSIGGIILVPDGDYVINTTPSVGTKSITWNISTGVTWSGSASWPRMDTNPAQVPVGLWIQSQSSYVSPVPNGGIAALNVEMLQPATYVGQSVAGYFGARGSNANAGANVWAINTLIRVDSGALGTYQCQEVDVDVFSDAALVKGISLSGAGTENPDIGIELTRANTSVWKVGLQLLRCEVGMTIGGTGLSRGIVINSPPIIGDTILTAKQLINNADSIVLQRNTDTAPTGFFMRCVNAANNANVFSLDVLGNLGILADLYSGADISSNTSEVRGPVTNSRVGAILLSASVDTLVGGSGAASATPASPEKYMIVNQNGTNYKIPLYLA